MKTKMIIIAVILLIAFSGPVYGEDLPDSLFPWGVYTVHQDSTHRGYMKDSLGFNLINLAWNGTDNHVIDFMNDGFVVYPNRGPNIGGAEYFHYAEAYYALIEAEDDTSEIKFEYHHPQGGSSDGFWYYESQTADTILSTLNWWHRQFNILDSSQPTTYTRFIRLKIAEFESDPLDTSDTLAILYSVMGDYKNDTTYISASDFYDYEADTFYTEPVIVDCDQFTLDRNRSVNYIIWSTGEARLYFDYIKVADQHGIALIDIGDYDARLIESAYYPFGTKRTAGWYMCDEPYYEQFRSLGYIDSLILANGTGDDVPRVVTAFNRYDSSSYGAQTYDFIGLAGPEVIWADIYLYRGGQVIEVTDTLDNSWYVTYWTTEYTGSVYDTQNKHKGLQRAFNDFDYMADYVNEACEANSIDWWLMPQAFAERAQDCWADNGYYYDYVSGWQFRMPTAAELSCCTFMGFCHHARGIVFWRYHTGVNNDSECPDYEKIGMINQDSTKNEIWYAVEEMAPYVKAIWPTLRDLQWDTAFCCSTSSQISIGTLVRSVSGYSETLNPDSGWFHIGEFYESDPGGSKYFILVNRACNKDSVTLAPDVNCVVYLDPSQAGSNWVRIIDIADTAYFDSDSLVVDSDTVYSAKLDGFIPYTTILKAGEGKLYKVQAVDTIDLAEGFSNSCYYQGGYTFDSTFVIDSTKTLHIRSPARLEFSANDTMIVRGGLLTTGCSDTSLGYVKFTSPDTVAWYGIHFINSNAIGKLDYCQIDNVHQLEPCILVDSSAVLEISNSDIEDGKTSIRLKNSGYMSARDCSFESDNTGIYNESGDSLHVANCTIEGQCKYGIKSYAGKIDVDSTDFDEIDYYGIYAKDTELETYDCNFSDINYYAIYADSSESEINNCGFLRCLRYGIYVDKGSSGTYDSTKIIDCEIDGGISPAHDSSQYCIRIDDLDKVRIEDNFLHKYKQGGIKLYNSDAKVVSNTIRSHDYYGIYSIYSGGLIDTCEFDSLYYSIQCNNGSTPKVRWCDFDDASLKMGVRVFGSGLPDLGNITVNSDTGFNIFTQCDSIYISHPLLAQTTLMAEGNYYGGGPPATGKISGPVDWHPYLRTEPQRGKVVDFIIPLVYELNSNYPNPFNPNTHISFSLEEPGYTTISIYNILGQKITSLVDEYKLAGRYSVMWDGTNRSGKPVSSGIYFYRLESNEFTDTKKMLLLR